jgi:hypothetical protein
MDGEPCQNAATPIDPRGLRARRTHDIESRSWVSGIALTSTPSISIDPETRCWSMALKRASKVLDLPLPVL